MRGFKALLGCLLGAPLVSCGEPRTEPSTSELQFSIQATGEVRDLATGTRIVELRSGQAEASPWRSHWRDYLKTAANKATSVLFEIDPLVPWWGTVDEILKATIRSMDTTPSIRIRSSAEWTATLDPFDRERVVRSEPVSVGNTDNSIEFHALEHGSTTVQLLGQLGAKVQPDSGGLVVLTQSLHARCERSRKYGATKPRLRIVFTVDPGSESFVRAGDVLRVVRAIRNAEDECVSQSWIDVLGS